MKTTVLKKHKVYPIRNIKLNNMIIKIGTCLFQKKNMSRLLYTLRV